jgi:NTP pyrophosphatase (non-canonical NTP hydrolase)
MDEYFKRDSERGLFPTFAWFVEEVGELGEALLKRDKAGVSEELADVIAWALSIANLVGIDVEEALRLKYGEVLLKGSASSCDSH